jgi:hypothetical protein
MTNLIVTDLFTAIHLGAIVWLAVMLARPRLREAFRQRFVGDASATDLAYVRIVICAVSILYVLAEPLPSQAYLSKLWFNPPGVLSWFGRDWWDALVVSQWRLQVFDGVLLLLLTLALTGTFTRVVLPLAAVVYLMHGGLLRGIGKLFHEGMLNFYVLIALCFLPCADAWSVDARWLRGSWARLLRRAPAAPGQPAAYAWAVYACFAAACVPYLQLGFSKLANGGLFWFDGRSMRNFMLSDCLNLTEQQMDLPLHFLRMPVWVFTAAGLIGLMTEVLYPTVLMVPRLRRVLPVCVIMLHLGIWVTQDQLFIDASMVPLIFFLPSRWPVSWRRAARVAA